MSCGSTAPRCMIGPSILNSDLSSLAAESQRLLDAGADYLHLDVMDGHFVPNLTFGHPVVKCLRSKIKSDVLFDVHMMVAQPQKWVEDMSSSGANQYTFHVEAAENVPALCRSIKEAGMRVGIGCKPGTAVSELVQYIDYMDCALIMTVEPGFGGQKFMCDMMPKIKYLREQFPNLDIEVDGGVSPTTIQLCADAGANMIVSGTAIIKSTDPRQVIKTMRAAVESCSSAPDR